jgi:nitrogen regulatory protein PII
MQMKMVTILIRGEQFPAVKKALFDAGFRHMTATTVRGTASKSEQQMYRGQQREISLFNRVRIELALQDENVDKALEAFAKGAKENGGFGRAFITELHDVFTAWTGERGMGTLHQ